jgi:motility quorum-sensing regulator/GCU-specific mRNA interferase toxin
MTEKRKATYDLEAIKEAFASVNTLNATTTALKSAAALGYGRTEIVDAIQGIHRSHFYKSMTASANYQVWQDVYHVPSVLGTLYVKFTVGTVTEFLLLSFKEKDNNG